MKTSAPSARCTVGATILLISSLILTGCAAAQDFLVELNDLTTNAVPASSPASTTAPVFSTGATGEGDYFTVLGTAQREYQLSVTGRVEYCPLDGLGRTVCAYGELSSSLRAAAQASERQEITIDPSGWPDGENEEVTIPAVPTTQDSIEHNGWFWNRSHLIADSLGGDAIMENLVTGTRTQNVGSTQVAGQYAGGMAYTELLARSYLDTQNGDACPLYYAATPVYQDAELVPRTVLVDIQSCDLSVDQRVEVQNAANGWLIDYATGQSSPASN